MSIQNKLGVFVAVVMLVPGVVSAATYNIWLKDVNGAPYAISGVKCAAAVVSTATDTVDIQDRAGDLAITIGKDCIEAGKPAADVSINGTVTVKSRMVATNASNSAVPSAYGVVGTLNVSSGVSLVLTDTGFTFTDGANPEVTGTYYLYNLASVPEPETLLLAAIGLAGLAWTRRKRR